MAMVFKRTADEVITLRTPAGETIEIKVTEGKSRTELRFIITAPPSIRITRGLGAPALRIPQGMPGKTYPDRR